MVKNYWKEKKGKGGSNESISSINYSEIMSLVTARIASKGYYQHFNTYVALRKWQSIQQVSV